VARVRRAFVTELSTASTSGRPASGPGARTIGRLWREGAGGREGTAYLVEEDGEWRPISWAEAAAAVDEIANGLLALGVGRGETFAIVGRTCVEWALIDFALALVGAVVAPVYPNSSARDTRYVLEHCGAVGAFVEDDAQRAKLEGVAGLREVVRFDELPALRDRGRAFAAQHPTALHERGAAVSEDDLQTFVYTSGTTGPPKACMIRHRHYYAMVATANELEPPLTRPGDVMLLYLPLAHNYGRLLHLSAPSVGFTIAFLPDPLRAADALPLVRPTLFPSVPRVYEKLHAAVTRQFDATTGIKRGIVDWALRVGYRASRLEQRGVPLPRWLAVQRRAADRLVYSKVKQRLGGRLRIANSGGAPLAPEILEFFHALGILVLEGYGLSECTTAATVNLPDAFRFGTVGRALPGVALRIADDGEVLIRSSTVFAGYYGDEAATDAVLVDGWLRTGDLGELDDDGFLRITGRKKDILVTAGGKNVAPQNIENELRSSRYVSQALVVGDRRPFVAALITLDEAALRADGFDAPPEELAEDERVRALIQAAVDQANRERSSFEQVKRFAILPRDFSPEDEEVTPTLKLRRRVCEEHFASTVDELYS
jgi:long-chain acyl-CoA synthetase